MSAGIRCVSCPRCGTQVPWVPASAFRPFCSERCKAVDLGAWATERYRVAAAEADQDAAGEPREPPK